MNKIIGLTLSPVLFALCSAGATLLALNIPVQAQPPAKTMPRIAIISPKGSPASPSPLLDAFRQGLRDLGYVDGKNILVEYRYAEGQRDRMPGLVAELVQLKVDVLVLIAITSIRAAKEATTTIPIVIVANVDPVATGIVDSLARPGGNITGLARLTRELSGKRLELLKEVIPGMSRVGILWNPDSPGAGMSFKGYESAARALKIPLQSLEVRAPKPDFEGAFQAATKGRTSPLILITEALINRNQKQIAELAIKNRVPSMCEESLCVEAGGLMSYAHNNLENWRRGATYVDKILKGAKPADLPVEQPTKFGLVINLKTAKQIGLTVPQSVLYRADRVIK